MGSIATYGGIIWYIARGITENTRNPFLQKQKIAIQKSGQKEMLNFFQR